MNGNKGEIRLYNVLVPLWLLFLFAPWILLIVIPANFAVDTIVLLVTFKCLHMTEIGKTWKSTIWLSWIFGFIADAAGNLIMAIPSFLNFRDWLNDGIADWIYHNIESPVMSNPFATVWGFLYTLIAVGVSALLIYVFNSKIALRPIENLRHRRITALVMAVATAPYLYFIPSQWFW